MQGVLETGFLAVLVQFPQTVSIWDHLDAPYRWVDKLYLTAGLAVRAGEAHRCEAAAASAVRRSASALPR